MDIHDIIFDYSVSLELKIEILRVLEANGYGGSNLKVLIPTDSNDDVNGSQHAENGGTDFTYRDVDMGDVLRASSLGVYEYFSSTGLNYTGHSYHGDQRHFAALVLDPPAYAAEVTL